MLSRPGSFTLASTFNSMVFRTELIRAPRICHSEEAPTQIFGLDKKCSPLSTVKNLKLPQAVASQPKAIYKACVLTCQSLVDENDLLIMEQAAILVTSLCFFIRSSAELSRGSTCKWFRLVMFFSGNEHT